MNIGDWIALLGAITGSGALIGAFLNRKKINAETNLAQSEVTTNYNRMANEWIERLEKKVRSLEDEIVELKRTINQYEKRIFDLLNELRFRDGNNV